MEFVKNVDKLSVKKIICCFTIKKDVEFIVSTGVIKLNVRSNNDSPKKKKNIQKKNNK
jgi:hypothetical protein